MHAVQLPLGVLQLVSRHLHDQLPERGEMRRRMCVREQHRRRLPHESGQRDCLWQRRDGVMSDPRQENQRGNGRMLHRSVRDGDPVSRV